MRAIENIIRLSAEKLNARHGGRSENPERQRAFIIAMLLIGVAGVIGWAGFLLYWAYRLAAWLAG